MGLRWWTPLLAVLLGGLPLVSPAAPLSQQRVIELCTQVDGPGHCGRRIETEQLKTLPNLAVRDGDTLRITLFPTGTREFVDTIVGTDERAYAIWDYWSSANAVVLFITDGDRLSYGVLQRTNGQLTTMPGEPVLAPDRQRIAVADFCANDCTNELTVWRVARDGIRKELSFTPATPWSDVTVSWTDGDMLVLQYTVAGEDKPRTVNRPLAAPDWKRSGTSR
jgi:hypothetical protein